MKRELLIALMLGLSLLVSCSGDETRKDDDQATMEPSKVDCASARMQKVLTYCASPQAAELAKRNTAARKALAKGGDASKEVMPLPVGDSPTKGPDDAAVTVLVFGDLECPFCSQGHAVMNQLREKYPDRVRLVYKHLPLSFHQRAVPSAKAAMAAGKQGKFWEYVDLAYARQDDLSEETLVDIAKKLQLNMETWAKDRKDPSFDKIIKRDVELAVKLGVNSTPTFALNGVLVAGALPVEAFEQFSKTQFLLADKMVAAGVPSDELYWRLTLAQYRAKPKAPETTEEDEEKINIAYVPVGDSPTFGAKAEDAVVTIVTFSDFECPYCADAAEPIKEAVAKHKDKVRLVFKHYPLPMHPMAKPAARASIVAAKHGKFWEFHDKLFANYDSLSEEKIKGFFKDVGLGKLKLDKELKDTAALDKVVNADLELGDTSGVEATPTFFINGIMIVGGNSAEDWSELLVSEIKRAESLKAETKTTGEQLYKDIVKTNKLMLDRKGAKKDAAKKDAEAKDEAKDEDSKE